MDWNKITSIEGVRLSFIIATTVLFYIIGIFGNVISLIIFNNKLFKSQPSTGYIQSFFVINIITILYIPIMFLTPIWIINTFTCKVFVGLFLLIIEIQAWVTAISSIDRLVTVLKPKQFLKKNNFKFQILIILIALLFVCLLLIPNGIFYDAVTHNNKTVCFYDDEWPVIYFKVQYLLFRVFLPFCLMVMSSVIITLKMCRMKAQLSNNLSRQREVNLFKALIGKLVYFKNYYYVSNLKVVFKGSDVFFILFRLPMLFYLLLNSDGANVIISLEYSIYMVIGLINNALIFVIMIAFNKIYRKLFFEYIRCKKDRENSAPIGIVLINYKRKDDQF